MPVINTINIIHSISMYINRKHISPREFKLKTYKQSIKRNCKIWLLIVSVYANKDKQAELTKLKEALAMNKWAGYVKLKWTIVINQMFVTYKQYLPCRNQRKEMRERGREGKILQGEMKELKWGV